VAREEQAGVRTQDGCAGHAGLGAEVRGVAMAVLDRLEPALERVRAGDPAGDASATCGICPVCAVLAALRREHPELAARAAEQAASMLAVLRTALEEGDPVAASAGRDAAPPGPPPEPARRVQRIPVERAPR
jgi:hypothetical protein